MTVNTTTTGKRARKVYHITDLFFRSELAQLAGSDAGDKWFCQQTQGGTCDCPYSTSSRPNPDAPAHRPAEPDSPKAERKQLNQDISIPTYLSMDEDLPCPLESSKRFQDCENDIGLLFTDAAHTVLTRLSSSPKFQ